ncbi:hypothetical protein ALC62_03207 [Cyphomyrmex costatus]|uniref:Peptidase aspartic putative domain-containing protein n=1 Tax=Cyphomyrmex costatus TaxID=456900 RepID=A0A151ILW1_9HYME|nr:hypothetical protein ALC62_03207 [Cyphomyrmex costatus]
MSTKTISAKERIVRLTSCERDMYAISNDTDDNDDDSRRLIERTNDAQIRKVFNNAAAKHYITEHDRKRDKNYNETNKRQKEYNEKEDRTVTTTVRILERRYPLTATGYKYLAVGIDVKLPCEVTIVLGDSHSKEMFLSPTVWSELVEQKRTILPLL